ncbi:MAG: hypothetical protein ABI867_03160 [Kofleriaceae bacterium]
MRGLAIIFDLLLIVGGILAMSGLIIAKKPDAKAILDKVMPFQALIGVAMLVLGIIYLIVLGPIAVFKGITVNPLPGAAALGGILVAIILGALFAVQQLAKMTGDLNAEQKALELSNKLAPFQMLLGLLAIACAVVSLLAIAGLLKIVDTVVNG